MRGRGCLGPRGMTTPNHVPARARKRAVIVGDRSGVLHGAHDYDRSHGLVPRDTEVIALCRAACGVDSSCRRRAALRLELDVACMAFVPGASNDGWGVLRLPTESCPFLA